MSADDRLAILDAIARYAHAWDERDAETYADSFTADAVFESYISREAGAPLIHHESRAEILTWARERAAALREKATRHSPGLTVFDELTAGAARTRTLLLESVQQLGEETPWLTNTGVYRDEWRKTSAGWKLARRTITHDRSQPGRPFDGPRPPGA